MKYADRRWVDEPLSTHRWFSDIQKDALNGQFSVSTINSSKLYIGGNCETIPKKVNTDRYNKKHEKELWPAHRIYRMSLYEQVPRHQAICKYIINILQMIRI